MMSRCSTGLAFIGALAIANSSTVDRRLTNGPAITGYAPGSNVQQHSYIDLDQAEFETHLGNEAWTLAKNIYQQGANSGAKAVMTVSALGADAAQGTAVTQANNAAATGTVKSTAAQGATSVQVTYTSTCKQGGTSTPDVTGCFTMNGGNIMVGGVDIGAPSAISNEYRTLAGFSTAAYSKMNGQMYYDPYYAYYIANGNLNPYAHQMVMDALNQAGTCSTCTDAVSRVEVAKKTSAYMNVWMYVIREMEDAVNDCQSGCINCNDDPVHAWDEGVAFYSGSREGSSEGGDSTGKLLYRLAQKRCANYGTCHSHGGVSVAEVNEQIFVQFALGRDKLQAGQCVETGPIKNRIVELMSVPLVQGALRYAWKIVNEGGTTKQRAEGHVFLGAILPRVHVCNATAAQFLRTNLWWTATTPMVDGYPAVKAAFENVYTCLGITCADVGFLQDSNGAALSSETVACTDPSPTTSAGHRSFACGLAWLLMLLWLR
jgi:hypothetical protein